MPVQPGPEYTSVAQSYLDDQPVKCSGRACGIRWDDGANRVAFLAFPYEAATDPGAILKPILMWLQDGSGETSADILVDVETSQTVYTYNTDVSPPAGDTFSVFGQAFNPGPEIAAQRWVLMQLGDMFWCLPSFTEISGGFDYYDIQLPAGFSSDEYFTFEWPSGVGAFPNGIFFWMAHLSANLELVGDLDYTEWGYM